MEGQANPPTPIEWEAALAALHAVREPPPEADARHAGEPAPCRCYLHGARAEAARGAVESVALDWTSFSLPVMAPVSAFVRLCAAYLGYYAPYIRKNAGRDAGLRPFYQELIQPYLDGDPDAPHAFQTLEAFLTRGWTFFRASMRHPVLKQHCFSRRMLQTEPSGANAYYPYLALGQLSTQAGSPRWAQVEDAMFDGVRPESAEGGDPAAAAQRNAGLFVHALYAMCV